MNHVIVLGHGRVGRQRDVAAVRIDSRDLLNRRIAQGARRRIDERKEHPHVDKAVAVVVAGDVAWRVQFNCGARGARVHECHDATSVHADRVILAPREVVDQSSLLIRHAITERGFTGDQVVHRFDGHANAPGDLLDPDAALRAVLIAGDGIGTILVRPERGRVAAMMVIPDVAGAAIVVGVLGLEPLLQIEGIVDAFRD